MIKPELIQFFVEIAKTNSIHLAAERLYVTQPAVSRGIRALEEEIGLTLFERKYDGTYLTKAGTTLLPYAQAMLDSLNQFQDQAATLKLGKLVPDTPHTNLTLFTSSAVLDRYIPYLTTYITNNLPHLHLHITEYSSKSKYTAQSVSELMLNQENTLGLYLIPNIADEIFETNGLSADILAIAKTNVMSSLHSKYISADTDKLLPKDLINVPFIIFSDPFLASTVYHEIMQNTSIKQTIIEESNMNLLLQYVRNDMGVTFACNIFDQINPHFRTDELTLNKEQFRYTPLVTPIYYKLILVYNKAILTLEMNELITVIKSMWR